MNLRSTLAAVALLCAGLASFPRPASGQAPDTAPKPRTGSIIITNTLLGVDKGKARTSVYLSAGLADVLKLHQAGVDEPVLLAFVQSSSVAYHPSAKEVIYLRDEGISHNVITALLKRGGELRERAAETEREERNRALPAAPANPPPSAAAPAVQAQPSAPDPVVYTTPTYVPTYVAAPVYSYSYASYPVYPYAGFGSWRYPGYGYSGYSGCGYRGSYSYCSPSFGVGFSYRSSGRFGGGVNVGFGNRFSVGSHHGGFGGLRAGRGVCR